MRLLRDLPRGTIYASPALLSAVQLQYQSHQGGEITTTRARQSRRPWPTSNTAEVPYDRPAPRQVVPYRSERSHEFEVTFAAGADPPAEWECRCGARASTTAAAGAILAAPGESEHDRCIRLVLQRRSRAALELLLAERLAELSRTRR